MSQEPAETPAERSSLSGTGQISKAWLWTFGISGLNLACGIVTGILVARFLLPEGRGILAALIFWPGLIWSLAMLGLRDAVTHRVARVGQPNTAVVASAFYLTFGVGILTAVVAAALLPYLLGDARRPFWAIAEIYAVTFIPLNSLVGALVAVDQGELRFPRQNLWGLASSLVHLCSLLTIWALGLISVATALGAFWLGTCVTAVALVTCRAQQLRARISRAELGHLIRRGATFHTTNLAYLLGTQIDRLVVILFWGDAAVGLYVVALTWASAGLNTITLSFRTVLFPHLSAETDAGRHRALLADGLRYASCLLTLGTLALASVTGWLLPLLFGTGFAEAVPVALALLAACWPLALRQIAIQGLRGLGQARPGTVAESLAILGFGVAVWPLGHSLELLGVPLALLLGNLTALAYLIGHLWWRLGIAPRAWWGFNPATVREIVRIGRRRLPWLQERPLSD